MGLWQRLITGCWWQHDLVKELRKKKLVLICAICGAEQQPLSKQKLKLRKEKKSIRLVKMKILAQGSRRS